MAFLVNWGVRATVSALLNDDRLKAEPSVKPLFQYGLLWSARSCLKVVCDLEQNSTEENVQLAYEKAQASLIPLMDHFQTLDVLPIVTNLAQESKGEIKKRAHAVITALEKVMQSEFPGLSLVDQMASQLFSSASTTLGQTLSTPSIVDWVQGVATEAGGRVAHTSAHFVMEKVEALNPPLKGLAILEPFKQIAPRDKVTAEMVKTKLYAFCDWSTAFASMKCVNTLFDFDDAVNPLNFEEQMHTTRRHGGVYKWVAQKIYALAYLILNAPLQRLFDGVCCAFLCWQKKDTESRVLDLLHLIEEWLSSVSEGYSKVAHLPPEEWGGRRVVDLLDEQIRTKLFGKKEIDLTQLCNRLVSVGIDLFCSDWMSCLEQSCLPWPVKQISKLLLFLPQLLWNFLLKSLARFILVWCIDMPGLLDAALKAPPTDASPSRFALQMKEWSYRQVGSMVNHVDQRLQTREEKISSKIQKDMHACLQVLLEVLHKSQYPTVEKLHSYIHLDHTFKEKFLKEMEEGALPVAMPVVALGLGTAVEKALGSQELLETVYDLLSIHDETLTLPLTTRPPTDDIGALVDALLERTACYGLSNPIAQRIAMKQATGFVSDITIAFSERAFLRSLLYKGLSTGLEIWKDTSPPQPT